MTHSDTEARANRFGDACPWWCTTDHEDLNWHASDPVGTQVADEPTVRLVKSAFGRDGNPVQIEVVAGIGYATAPIVGTGVEGKKLAEFIEHLAGLPGPALHLLADQVRTAVTIAEAAE